MIDIHCHLLYGVDDGPRRMEESCEMLDEAKRQGIRAMILTPHYRHGMFPYDTEVVWRHYRRIRQYALEIGIPVYLGTEYHIDSNCIEYLRKRRCLSLADSEYVLSEYSSQTEFLYICNMTQEMLSAGYIPVIAHAERYECLTKKPELAEELRRMGALIQVNADAVLGLDGRNAKKFCKVLLKSDAVDVVASDSHGMKNRPCHMQQCLTYVEKKYGKATARRIFVTTPLQIIKKPGE